MGSHFDRKNAASATLEWTCHTEECPAASQHVEHVESSNTGYEAAPASASRQGEECWQMCEGRENSECAEDLGDPEGSGSWEGSESGQNSESLESLDGSDDSEGVRRAQRARRCWRHLRARRARRAPRGHSPPHPPCSHRHLRPLHKSCPPWYSCIPRPLHPPISPTLSIFGEK
eukprot:gene10218-biopygen19788